MSVKGFDFSSWQDAPDTPNIFPDFIKAKQQAEFCVARAAYGITPDRIFPRGYDEAVKVGLITGVYQFVDYRVTALQNFDYLIAKLAGRKPAFIALDLEQNETYWPGGWPSDKVQLVKWCLNYYDAWKASGITSPLILYTNVDTIKQMRVSTKLVELSTLMPLWVAWYSATKPDLSSVLPWTKYLIWQPTPSAVGHLYGMESGNVDTDTWTGTIEELREFTKGTPIAPVVTGTLEERIAIVEQKLKDHGW